MFSAESQKGKVLKKKNHSCLVQTLKCKNSPGSGQGNVCGCARVCILSPIDNILYYMLEKVIYL